MERTRDLQHHSCEKNLNGWINGFIGVVIFSASLPATKMAVLEFDPVFLTLARATIAGVLALASLACSRPGDRSASSLSPCCSWLPGLWSASPC